MSAMHSPAKFLPARSMPSVIECPAEVLEAALWLAEHMDWAIFAATQEKKPFHGTSGFKDATKDLAALKGAFSSRQQATVAVATGSASGFFAVDVDIKDVGWTGLEEFERRHGVLPPTLTVNTPSGGRHYLYRYPDNVRIGCRTDIDGLKIDIRGEGGYVIAPPSRLADGCGYAFANDMPVMPAPDWLVRLLTSQRRSQANRHASSSSGSIVEGGRNNTLTSIAGRMRATGANEEEMAAALFDINIAQCRPPLPESEVSSIARSVAKYPAGSPHADTDVGNARRLVDALKGNARYDYASGKWRIFNGRYWRLDEDGGIIREAKAVGDRQLTDAQKVEDPDHRKRKVAFAVRTQSNARINAMVELARSEAGISIDAQAFDQPPYLLNVWNGTVDLRSGALRSHERADLLSRIIELEYDPRATCPLFMQFIEDIFQGDRSVIEFIHRFLGYCATAETREQAFCVFNGAGANGKSTLLKVVSDTLGSFAAHTATETLLVKSGGATNDIARLEGVRFLTASEADSHQRLNQSLIKQMTGDERLTARALYQEYREFSPTFKLVLATNSIPQVNGSDPALFRRLKLISFDRVFAAHEQDKEMGAKLAAERPGILAWLVAGAVKWYADGLQTPEGVERAGAEFRADSDTVGVFIEERCEVVAGEALHAGTLFRDYSSFTAMSGRSPLNQTAFGLALRQRGIVAQKRGGVSYRLGVRYRPLEI